MLAVNDPDGRQTGSMALLYAVALVPGELVADVSGCDRRLVFLRGAAPGRGVHRRRSGHDAIRQRPPAPGAFSWWSVIYLPALLTLMVIDKLAAPEGE
jgi:hypothetical protein